MAVSRAGCWAGEGLDQDSYAYGKVWKLHVASEQKQCAWIVTVGLKPRAAHIGTPCTRLCRIGQREADQECLSLIDLTEKVCEHQDRNGLLASVENPKGSMLYRMDSW